MNHFMDEIRAISKEIDEIERSNRAVKNLCTEEEKSARAEADKKKGNLQALRTELQQEAIDTDPGLVKAKNDLQTVEKRYGYLLSKRRGLAVDLEKIKKERGIALLYNKPIDDLNRQVNKLETNLDAYDNALAGYEPEKYNCEQNIIRTRTAAERKAYQS